MNNLNLPQVAPNQASKELTINDQALALDAAITESLALDASTGQRVVTLKEFTRNVLFTVTAASNGAEIIVPEGVYRMFALRNRSANGIVLKSGSMTFPIPAGGGGIYHTSETVLQAVVSGATSDHDSIGEAPNDGDLYGRKNEAWEVIPEPEDPGGGASVLALAAMSSTVPGTLNTGTYCVKGLLFDVTRSVNVVGVSAFLGGSGTYDVIVAKLDDDLKVRSMVKQAGVEPGGASAFIDLLLPSSLALTTGDKLGVVVCRTDGTDSTAAQTTVTTSRLNTLYNTFGLVASGYIQQRLLPVAVNDTLEVLNNTSLAFTFPLITVEI